MSEILKANPIVETRSQELKSKCDELKNQGIEPFMKVILVGDNPASLSYIKNKKKLCEKVGAKFELIHLDATITEDDLIEVTQNINQDPLVHGCIIQLPLPSHLSHIDVSHLINPQKDIDGFHPENLYCAMVGDFNGLLPCTPQGVLSLCDYYKIDLSGKNVVIIGRSMIVGKPLAILMTNRNATVTLCHSRTQNMKELTKKADIIVTAIGKANFLDSSFLNEKSNQYLIDVGINKYNGKLCGDINFTEVENKVKGVTPVPGGIGPLTVLSLIENLLKAAGRNEAN